MASGWWAEAHPVISMPVMLASAELFVPLVLVSLDVHAPVFEASAEMFAPAISASSSVAVPVMEAAAAMPTPVVAAGKVVPAPSMTATAEMYAPAISVSSTVSAPVMEAAASMPAPQVILGSGFPYTFPFTFGEQPIGPNVNVASPAMGATSELYIPSIGASSIVTAPVMGASAAMLSPLIAASATVPAPAMGASAAMLVPTMSVVPSVVVEFDSYSVSTQSTGDISWAHTAEADTAVLANVIVLGNTTINAVTYEGAAMTLNGSVPLNNSTANGILYQYKITGVAGGGTVAVDKNGFNWVFAGAYSFLNVGTIGTPQTVYGTGTSLSQGPITVPEGAMVAHVFANASTKAFTATSGGTNLFAGTTATFAVLSLSDADESTAFTATISGAAPWAGIATVLTT